MPLPQSSYLSLSAFSALPCLSILVWPPPCGRLCPEDLCCMCLLVCFDRQGLDLVPGPAVTQAEGCVNLILHHVSPREPSLRDAERPEKGNIDISKKKKKCTKKNQKIVERTIFFLGGGLFRRSSPKSLLRTCSLTFLWQYPEPETKRCDVCTSAGGCAGL